VDARRGPAGRRARATPARKANTLDAGKLALPLLAVAGIAGGIVAVRLFGLARVARAGMTMLAAVEAWRRAGTAASDAPQLAHQPRGQRKPRASAGKTAKKSAAEGGTPAPKKKREPTPRKATAANGSDLH